MPILSKENFDAYAAAWVTTVENNDKTDWLALFQLGTAIQPPQPQTNVCFDINNDIIPLISTPCVTWIVASFLYNPPQPGAPSTPSFQIALWGTDGKRDDKNNLIPLTPYYSGTTNFAAPGEAIVSNNQEFANMSAEEIPCNVVNYWLSAWTGNSGVNSSQFYIFDEAKDEQSVLQGYAFPFNDFVNPLFRIEPSQSQISSGSNGFCLKLDFGLKTYLPVAGNTVQLFGILTRVADRDSKNAVSSASFDLSMPYPPGPPATNQ